MPCLKIRQLSFSSPCNWVWHVGQVQRRLLMVSGDALGSTGWMRISFSSKLTCKMLSMLSPDRRYWMTALHSSQSSYHGYLGAMGPTPCFGTHLARSLLQQGDPLGPLLFALVLHKLVASMEADDECFDLLIQAWYLDDGALAGSRPAVLRALHLIEEMGPALGLHVYLAKCELYRATPLFHLM